MRVVIFHFHFIDEEMGVWRGGIMCPRSHLSSQMEMYLNPGSRVSILTHHTLLPYLPSPFMVGGEKREERPLCLTVEPSTGMKTGNVLPSSLASIVCRERNAVRALVWCVRCRLCWEPTTWLFYQMQVFICKRSYLLGRVPRHQSNSVCNIYNP